MSSFSRVFVVLLGAAGLLSACGKSDQAKSPPVAPAVSTSQEPAADSGVKRVEVRPTDPSPAQAAPQRAAIQTQPGPKGSQVALNKVAVTGDIMTVQLTFTADKGGTEYVPLNEVSVIDDATAQQIGVLRDNAGNWLASPLQGKDRVNINLYSSPAIVWFKFPAPPATTKTVSINIPTVGPFDGVPVTR